MIAVRSSIISSCNQDFEKLVVCVGVNYNKLIITMIYPSPFSISCNETYFKIINIISTNNTDLNNYILTGDSGNNWRNNNNISFIVENLNSIRVRR